MYLEMNCHLERWCRPTKYKNVPCSAYINFRKLNDTFGACGRPHVGWQIDPFGHSREMASMFARMGYDGLLFARLDYQDKDKRLLSQTAELVWEGSPSLGKFLSGLSIFYHN